MAFYLTYDLINLTRKVKNYKCLSPNECFGYRSPCHYDKSRLNGDRLLFFMAAPRGARNLQ